MRPDSYKFSIIVPCYNQGAFLPATLDSVLAQSYQNWECLIIDDGSCDNTAQIAQKYCGLDNRFCYIHKPNGGLSSARNKGLEAVKGNLVQFLDSDDLLLPDRLERVVEILAKEPEVDVVYSDFAFFTGDPSSPWIGHPAARVSFKTHNPYKELLCDWSETLSIPIHCFVFRFSVLSGIHFDASLPALEDWDFHLQVARKATNYKFDPFVGCLYRTHVNSMTRNYMKMVSGMYRFLNKQYGVGRYRRLVAWRGAIAVAAYTANMVKRKSPTILQAREVYVSDHESLKSPALLWASLSLAPAAFVYKTFAKFFR